MGRWSRRRERENERAKEGEEVICDRCAVCGVWCVDSIDVC